MSDQTPEDRLEELQHGAVVELQTTKESFTGTVDHDGAAVTLSPISEGLVERYDISGDRLWEVSWPEDGVESDERSLGIIQSVNVIEGE